MRNFRIFALLAFAALLAWLAFFTCSKLYKMTAIRGLTPGAVFREHRITDKRALDGSYGPAYWIAWNNADITKRSDFREILQKEAWEKINIGDRVTIAYYRDDPTPYKPDGIFDSPGNFIFDLALLTGELMMLVMSLRVLAGILVKGPFGRAAP